MEKIEKIAFYLIVLLLPTQLGKHFWPDFSNVLGLRVDYLSPAVYVTDLLILSLFIIFASKKKNMFRLLNNWMLGVFLVLLGISIFQSKIPQLGAIGIIKFLEFFFFGWYVAFASKINIKTSALLFSIGVLFESFLSITQFINQASIGGLFYFFGERTFTSQTVGIANASLGGDLVLRPYGTFPHPNVLAAYLLLAMTVIISNFHPPTGGSNLQKTLFTLALVVGSFVLLLTMSRIVIVLWMIILAVIFFRKRKLLSPISLLLAGSILALVFSPLQFRFSNVSLSEESLFVRWDLSKKSLLMIRENPVFGVGLNNFLVNLSAAPPKIFYSVNYLQPVHNIYLLIASETGIVGFVFFLWFLGKTYKRIMNYELGIKGRKFTVSNFRFIIFSSTLLLGFFDHYFLTLQQGQLLLAFIFGLCWQNIPHRLKIGDKIRYGI